MRRINIFFMTALLCGWAMVAQAQDDFSVWLAGLKQEAQAAGIAKETLEAAFHGVAPNELVLKLDRNQPEFTLSLVDYLGRTISPTRIRKGVDFYHQNKALLAEIAAKHGVQPRFILALWGIETDFGRVTGSFDIIEALATLAHDPRRSQFFRRELLDALRILDSGAIGRKEMLGSWAGAFGGLQFLPSVYQRYAVDFDGDGKKDLWHDRGDLFASGANYLARSGWRIDQTWGREVRLPAGLDENLTSTKVKKRISAWQALGVRRPDGSELPTRDLLASIVIPDKEGKRAFMVYNNFDVLLEWNRSLYYATAVGLLSDLIADGIKKR